MSAQRCYENSLWAGCTEFNTRGYCIGCDKLVSLKVDMSWGDGVSPNWRERLECPCGLNNRSRASLDFLADLLSGQTGSSIYATEQVTSLFRHLRVRYPSVIGSEFLRDGTPSGNLNGDGLRHEDLTRLSFTDCSFDAVLSFDVLEHIPDYKGAIREISRVLKPGGYLLASFPFNPYQANTLVRASVGEDGTVIHHLPPEYHGDPVDNSGCLCFQVFGWDVLDYMLEAGFADAYTTFYWSSDRGYLGANQLMIIGRR